MFDGFRRGPRLPPSGKIRRMILMILLVFEIYLMLPIEPLSHNHIVFSIHYFLGYTDALLGIRP